MGGVRAGGVVGGHCVGIRVWVGVASPGGIVERDRPRRGAARDGGFQHFRTGGADESLGQVEDQ